MESIIHGIAFAWLLFMVLYNLYAVATARPIGRLGVVSFACEVASWASATTLALLFNAPVWQAIAAWLVFAVVMGVLRYASLGRTGRA
jgi:hypothetical protein